LLRHGYPLRVGRGLFLLLVFSAKIIGFLGRTSGQTHRAPHRRKKRRTDQKE